MRVPTLAAVALAALLTACAASPRGDARDDLSTSETLLHPHLLLALPVSTTPGDTLYRNPMFGIDVVDVLADGRPIAPQPSLVLFLNVDTRPVVVQSGTYIYGVDLERMLFWKPDSSLVEYSIPEDTEVLVIRYRLVRHCSAPGERVYNVKATRSP